MTNVSTPIKLVVSLVVVAALVATRFSSTNNAPTRSNLKGSRKLQVFPSLGSRSPFTGGIISGTSTGGGAASGTGSAMTVAVDNTGLANAAGGGNFTSSSSGSGFIDTPFIAASGSSAAGGTGSNAGAVDAMLGVGTLSFNGTTTTSGTGGFGAGVSPVGFNTVTTEVPGAAFTIKKRSKKGGASTAFGPSTFTTTVTPFSTGPTGGFGTGTGSLNIGATTTGTLLGDGIVATIGTGSSGGAGTSFGGGTAMGANLFGMAGGVGSGTGTVAAAGSGTTSKDATNGIFTGTGGSTGSFNNVGSGIFGTAQTLTFP